MDSDSQERKLSIQDIDSLDMGTRLSLKSNGSKVHKQQIKRAAVYEQHRKSMPAGMFGCNTFYKTPTPTSQSPVQITIRTAPHSRTGSFSGSFGEALPMSIQLPPQPPTPQSPYYMEEDLCDQRRSITPPGLASGYLTPVTSHPQSMSSSFDGSCGLRLDLTPHSPLDAMALRSSPGSLSSCSTATSAGHASDYFGCTPHQSPNMYMQPQQPVQYPMSPVAIPPYHQQHFLPSHPSTPFQTSSFEINDVSHVEVQQPGNWYPNNYDQSFPSPASREQFYQDMPLPCIKQEPGTQMLSPSGNPYC